VDVQDNQKRILTSHTGSLPRPPELIELLQREERGEAFDIPQFEQMLFRSIMDVVEQQVRAGLDIVNDGEFGKSSYATYVQQRLSGFDEVDRSRKPPEHNLDFEEFPEYYQRTRSKRGLATRRLLACVGPVTVRDSKPVARDVKNLQAAIAAPRPVGGFMTAASPGVVARFHPNLFYDSHNAFRDAVGAAMQMEYESIVKAGLQLQVDCPDLAAARCSVFSNLTDTEFLHECEQSIEVLNHALRNIPAERIRLHVCWGNYEGPHVHDIALRTILPVVLRAKIGVLSIEGANPRHAHEWQVWRDIKLPDDKIVMPGVIDSTTNFVEHPQLVAQRICQYASVVGRDRVIAGVDCGFETFAGDPNVDSKIVYRKIEALAEGARIASEKLWPEAEHPAALRGAGAGH
jgi:5-methyltetrahydropteroyltriglutamate--homocysteine methyltransferase